MNTKSCFLFQFSGFFITEVLVFSWLIKVYLDGENEFVVILVESFLIPWKSSFKYFEECSNQSLIAFIFLDVIKLTEFWVDENNRKYDPVIFDKKFSLSMRGVYIVDLRKRKI